MDLNDAVVTCACTLEWRNDAGVTGRKVSYRIATLRLIRNSVREVYIEINNEKNQIIKLKLKDVLVHKKFMTEGKASITFKAEKCVLLISNAPPASLVDFLKIMFFKLSGNENLDEATIQKNLRTQLLSGKPTKFEEISPVTSAEMIMAKKKAGLLPKSSLTTPSPPLTKKRKFEELKSSKDIASKGPIAKKLYQTSPLAEENLALVDEQKQVLQMCISGKSVFFTGSAGTGKSFLLRKIISSLPPDSTIATASTGVAACLVGGVTLHSFAGIGSGEASLQRCYEMASKPVSAQNWRKCKTLIIDEISMVDCQYFDKIEAVARYIRRNDKPFGGIQLILCGDFLQLPPVIKRDFVNGVAVNQNNKRFCFQSESWAKCVQVVFELKQVHRQTDSEFIKILNHIRIGHVTEEVTKCLLNTSKQKIEGNGILATQLCSHTSDSDSINQSKLNLLTGAEMNFKAEDSDPSMLKMLDSQIQVPSSLVLKIGAQVMLLKNINLSAGLVNGARGVVCKFEKSLPVVRFKNNNEYLCKPEKWVVKTPSGVTVTRKQIPLKLAWAFSIHKSQGLTLDCVEMSLSKVFEAGQAYVALSRAKSLDSIRILDFDSKQVWANPEVLQFYKQFRRRLHDLTIIPLGNKSSNGNKEKMKTALTKLKKSLMDKPLVSIC
ncbi:ATP-dependent DNA helicase PIF1 [Condylostylus longicornis]|uniref:ATP-dependent DNA helicase PIF1 n=1 Tax=Condylostylus longicornis TaxID=2530218 RepID=UPI00244DAF37|nr:ATP-dependent DNA helicase PIF1 [Condylostylus longicornis]